MSKRNLFFSALGALTASAYLVIGIFQSTSSTAPVGFLFLPVFAVLGAGGGFFFGFVLESLQLLIQKKISIFSWRIFLSIVCILLISFILAQRQKEKQLLSDLKASTVLGEKLSEIFVGKYFFFSNEIRRQILASPDLSQEIIDKVFASGTKDEIGVLGENPQLNSEALQRIVELDLHYAVHFGVAENPKLNISQMEKLVVVDASRFPSETEFHLYQTFVLAKLVRRKDFPDFLFRKISNLKEPEVFLLYAMLDSSHLRCENFLQFESKGNEVVQSAIEAKKIAMECK